MLEETYATEHRDEVRAKELMSRARQASISYRMVRDARREERLNDVNGSPELYWKARLFAIEEDISWKKMRIGELRERTRLTKRVGDRFRSMLPESVVDRLSRAEVSPGEVVIELTAIRSRNLELAEEALRLEEEEERLRNALEADRVAYSNVASLNGLSLFEKEVLDTLPNLPKKSTTRISGFGLNYLAEVETKRETLDLRLKGMETEMDRLRSVTVAAINAVEKGEKQNDAQKLLRDCETAASDFIKHRP